MFGEYTKPGADERSSFDKEHDRALPELEYTTPSEQEQHRDLDYENFLRNWNGDPDQYKKPKKDTEH